MKDRFRKHIIEQNLFYQEDKLIVAISGGADSVALSSLLKDLGYSFIMVHCNFQLRGKESDEDEIFVKELAKEYGVDCKIKYFETQKYATKNKLSVQMAARELRYEWFEQLREEAHAKYILVAHHKDDDIETFFINLIRGSGIRGFLGMKQKNNNIIRPLLSFSRKEIEEYLKTKNQPYRTDSSNIDTKYLRNNIRKHLVPLIKDINPSFSSTFSKEIHHLNEVYSVFQKEVERVKKDLISVEGAFYNIDKNKLLSLSDGEAFLREIIAPFGFTETNKIFESCKSFSGKMFYSERNKLLVDRDKITIIKREDISFNEIKIPIETQNIITPISLQFRKSVQVEFERDKKIAFFDEELLQFPLTIRKWIEGDYFYPIGMRGSKKISDYFVDNKFSRFEKEECFLLCSGEDIVWIIGHRMDERFKITQNTKKVYIAELF